MGGLYSRLLTGLPETISAYRCRLFLFSFLSTNLHNSIPLLPPPSLSQYIFKVPFALINPLIKCLPWHIIRGYGSAAEYLPSLPEMLILISNTAREGVGEGEGEH